MPAQRPENVTWMEESLTRCFAFGRPPIRRAPCAKLYFFIHHHFEYAFTGHEIAQKADKTG
jgi:hypothetical protein